MICEFCKSEIANNALVCPHCRKRTHLGRSGFGGKIAAAALLLVVGFFVLAKIAAANDKPPADRIREACQEQFPNDLDRETRCELELSASALEKADRDRLAAAARRAGAGN